MTLLDTPIDKNRKAWLKTRRTLARLEHGRVLATLYPHSDKTLDPKTGKPSPAVKVFDEHSKSFVYLPLHVYNQLKRQEAQAHEAIP